MQDFISTAASRETSPELMAAILKVASGDASRAESIWENGPTSGELVAIVEIVTGNGRTETTDYCWGAMGSRWESELAGC